MKVLGFRFCTVSPEAPALASFLDALGFERHTIEGGGENQGAVFAAGESWLAMWPPSAEMAAGMMLQVVVDDADAFAARALEQGLNPIGPKDSRSKRIYFLQAPTGLQISIQSRLPGQERSAPPPAPTRTSVAPSTAAVAAQASGAPPAAAAAQASDASPAAAVAARASGAPAQAPAPGKTSRGPAQPAASGKTSRATVQAPVPARPGSLPAPPPIAGRVRAPGQPTVTVRTSPVPTQIPAPGRFRMVQTPPPPPVTTTTRRYSR